MQSLLALALLALILGCNVWNVLDFVRAGRGRLFDALAYVEAHDPSPVVLLTGDHDFRVGTCCSFYLPYLQSEKSVSYLRRDDLPKNGAGWLIVHRLDDQPAPGEVERDALGNPYRLVRAYPTAGVGCWGWFVYRNERAGPEGKVKAR